MTAQSEALDRVWAMHTKDYGYPTVLGIRVKGAKAETFCRQCQVTWPCETAVALDPTLGETVECPYTFAHTRHWCGYSGCRGS